MGYLGTENVKLNRYKVHFKTFLPGTMAHSPGVNTSLIKRFPFVLGNG